MQREAFCDALSALKSFSAGALPRTKLGELTTLEPPSTRLGYFGAGASTSAPPGLSCPPGSWYDSCNTATASSSSSYHRTCYGATQQQVPVSVSSIATPTTIISTTAAVMTCRCLVFHRRLQFPHVSTMSEITPNRHWTFKPNIA